MNNLVLPESVTIELKDSAGLSLKMANVLVQIHTFARRKNDFFLGPYVSDADGVIRISKQDLGYDVQATYDSGLMDYVAINDCFPKVEIRLLSEEQILQTLESRLKVWKALLKGERERWGSMENLLQAYKKSRNAEFEGDSKLEMEWNGQKEKYFYDFCLQLKRGGG